MSSNGNRISGHIGTPVAVKMYVMDCPNCGIIFGITEDYEDRRREDGKGFHCPNGHSMSWTPGKSDATKLREAEERLRLKEAATGALKDQLAAAVRDAESVRVALLRDRQRFANGVCPCCNRSFENVMRHMKGEHPNYDVTKVERAVTRKFACSCGRKFDTLRGLRAHQGWMRDPKEWDRPETDSWSAHLTKV